MTKEDKDYVKYRIVDEGMHYTFADYSDFKEIKDEKFHKLRLAYLEAADQLKDYVN